MCSKGNIMVQSSTFKNAKMFRARTTERAAGTLFLQQITHVDTYKEINDYMTRMPSEVLRNFSNLTRLTDI